MIRKNITYIIFCTAFFTFLKCSKVDENSSSDKVFSSLDFEETGINFSNNLVENDSLNFFTYSYLYMGGGISAGDINNDGLIDLYFTGNQVSNKLYINKGNLTFEDITEKAGVSGDERWYTGSTMADVNGDGFLDIYCSVSGKFGSKTNQLFINNQDGTFTEKAKEFGLDDKGNTIQATFFDYDNDGDLDVYVANYPPTKFSSPVFVYQRKTQNVNNIESDHLYKNENNHFVDVTEEAGLKSFGLSLSATVGDLNNDGWSDIYVSNDFATPDYLFINNKNGTFREVVKEATSHTAFYGMGVDISDFNNDGNLDIFQVDMDSQSNKRQKANMASMNPDLFWGVVNAGFHYQYMQNCMQINSGVFENDNPHFSNISRMTGTSSTDWSWGPLFADFDNDGFKDLYITNGTRRDVNNKDFFKKIEKEKINIKDALEVSLRIPSEKIDNYMFKNNGNLDFEQTNKKWGIEYKGFSNGVVYADLDNDGDLEIITNNIDDYASIFENKSADFNNYIKVEFEGEKANKFGLGNRVYIKIDNKIQMQELTLTRGYQSSVAPELHFGLGKSITIDEVKVVWQNGKVEVLKGVSANQKITFNYQNALEKNSIIEKKEVLFTAADETIFPKYKHEENNFNDFAIQVLLPHRMSTFGPTLSVGDLNNDGLDDYFVGGSSGKKGAIFYQNKTGFEEVNTSFLEEDITSEDLGSLIFDADNDGDNDLYVVSGGYEFLPNATELQDRLYVNDGNGNFNKKEESLPKMILSGSKVYAADFDKDGKEDLLVLGRQTPRNYPTPTDSFLLKNVSEKGNPKFDFFDENYLNPFRNLGMATSAVITDFNNDSWLDIIIVGEWMPIKIFKNTQNGFQEVSKEMGLTEATTGWWWSINQGDFDNDGDMDYVLGNNGLNYKYKATENETFDIYVNDFDKNTKNDIVLSYYNEGKQYPVRGRQCSSEQIPGIKKKFENYESFSEATLVDVYTKESLKNAVHYQVKSFASIYLENKNGQFVIHHLPIEAQFSSINKIIVKDFDKDNALDIVIAGNLYSSEVETPRNDASHGLFLKGDNKGGFKVINPSESGLFIQGDVKELSTIHFNNLEFLIAAKNNEFLEFLKLK